MVKHLLFFYILGMVVIPQNAVSAETSHRGMFVTVMDSRPVLFSREQIEELIDFARRARINTLFVQIYRANKAWFPSQVGDSTPYRTSLENLGEDAFAFLIKSAHESGIEVHAWLNLLSLSQNKNARLLKKYGPSILTRNLKQKNKIEDYKIDNQYFLEPGDARVRAELSTMVEEIVKTYPELDGIQFDYIRYPDANPFYGYTKSNMRQFQTVTGQAEIAEDNPAWKQWRRDQVTGLVKQLMQAARAIRPDIQVSTTGCVSYSRAYHEAFQDWASWLNTGLVDFVTLMSYPKNSKEFESYVNEARGKAHNFQKVNIAVGAYKLVDAPGLFKEQYDFCKQAGSGACVVFHYGSFLENPALSELWTNGLQITAH